MSELSNLIKLLEALPDPSTIASLKGELDARLEKIEVATKELTAGQNAFDMEARYTRMMQDAADDAARVKREAEARAEGLELKATNTLTRAQEELARAQTAGQRLTERETSIASFEEKMKSREASVASREAAVAAREDAVTNRENEIQRKQEILKQLAS
jgi:uncharacterized protein (DUF3084 family)